MEILDKGSIRGFINKDEPSSIAERRDGSIGVKSIECGKEIVLEVTLKLLKNSTLKLSEPRLLPLPV